MFINHEITYDTGTVCKGTCTPVAPLLKVRGGSAPVMHPRSGVPARVWLLEVVSHVVLYFVKRSMEAWVNL